MQEFEKQTNISEQVSFQELSFDDQQGLVGAFAWLVEQDKKQNPELYKRKYRQND